MGQIDVRLLYDGQDTLQVLCLFGMQNGWNNFAVVVVCLNPGVKISFDLYWWYPAPNLATQ
jgi:hypothetical protein